MPFVFLIGFMGAGKTFYADKLARELQVKFIDLDNYIQHREGEIIANIFKLKGEAYFRDLESQCLLSILSTKEKTIVACGGGTPCFNNNIDLLNKKGATVYLKTSAKLLLKRVTPQKAKRPLIAHLNRKELLKFIELKNEEREPCYLKAQYVFEAEKQTYEVLKSHVESQFY